MAYRDAMHIKNKQTDSYKKSSTLICGSDAEKWKIALKKKPFKLDRKINFSVDLPHARLIVGLPVGWLFGWSVDWLVGRLNGRSAISRPVGRSVFLS